MATLVLLTTDLYLYVHIVLANENKGQLNIN
jgi:hypothetical protein